MKLRDRIKSLRRVKAKDLWPNPKNWRTHSEAQINALHGVLAEVGIADTLLARELPDGGLMLIDGHLRADMIPDTEWPVLVLDVTEEEADLLLATVDPLAGMAGADQQKLGELLAGVEAVSGAVQAMLDGLAEEHGIDVLEEAVPDDPGPQIDRAAELQEEWGTATGQVWEIPGKAGTHRVMCGDTRQVLPTLADGTFDMVFADPPYGHNNNNGDLIARREAALGRGEYKPGKTDRPIANDGPEANELVRLMFAEVARLLKPGCCCCCCCCGGGPDPQFARWSLWLDEVMPFKMCVVWDKGGLGMGWHYRRCWECVLVAQNKGAACNWHGGKNVPNVIRDIGKIIPSADQHPTEKPPELTAWFLRLHSAEGETVLDPFLGSGTTLIACEQLGRVGYGIEIEPKYVAVTLQRLADMGLTPKLAKS